MKLLHNIKAQLTVVGLLLIFLTIIILSIMTPTLLTHVGYIATNLTASGYPNEALLAKLIPLFVLGTILASIAVYGTAQQ